MRRTLPALVLSLAFLLSACGDSDEASSTEPMGPKEPAVQTSKDLVLEDVQDACSAVSATVLERAGTTVPDERTECRWTSKDPTRSLSTAIVGALKSLGGTTGAELASGGLAEMRASGGEKVEVPGAAEAVLEVDELGGMVSLTVTARYRNALAHAQLIPPHGTAVAAAKRQAPVVGAAVADVVAELRTRGGEDGSGPSDEPTQLVPDAAPGACSAVTAEHLAALGLEEKKAGSCDWSAGQLGKDLRTLHAFDLGGMDQAQAKRSYERALGREDDPREVVVTGAVRAELVDESDERHVDLKVLVLGETGFARLTFRAPVPADRAALEKALLTAAADVVAALDVVS